MCGNQQLKQNLYKTSLISYYDQHTIANSLHLKDAAKFNQDQISESNFVEPITENNAPQTGPGRTVSLVSIDNENNESASTAAVPNIGDNPSEQTNNSENSQVNAPSTQLNEEEVVSTPNEEPVNEELIEEETISAISYRVNILHGQNDVEVNSPFVMDIQSGISTENTNIENSYFTDSEGKVLYSRIEVRPNQVILIPQIKLQPTKQYTAVIGGLKNIYQRNILSFLYISK